MPLSGQDLLKWLAPVPLPPAPATNRPLPGLFFPPSASDAEKARAMKEYFDNQRQNPVGFTSVSLAERIALLQMTVDKCPLIQQKNQEAILRAYQDGELDGSVQTVWLNGKKLSNNVDGNLYATSPGVWLEEPLRNQNNVMAFHSVYPAKGVHQTLKLEIRLVKEDAEVPSYTYDVIDDTGSTHLTIDGCTATALGLNDDYKQ